MFFLILLFLLFFVPTVLIPFMADILFYILEANEKRKKKKGRKK